MTTIAHPTPVQPPPAILSEPLRQGESVLSRAVCGVGAGAWVVVFAGLWLAAPPLARGLGLAWFALAAAWPAGFLFSLALAMPWFGNNPGGPHHLYLIDMALMGLVARHLAGRALGLAAPRRNRLDPWITLFVAYSWVTLLPQWRWLRCEFLTPHVEFLARHPGAAGPFVPIKAWVWTASQFLFRMWNRDVTTEVFGLQLALKLALGAGLYGFMRDCPWNFRRHTRLWWTLLAGVVVAAVIGWLNYWHWLPLDWWREENPFIARRFGRARLQSIFWHPGWLAQYLEMLAPAALVFALAARRPPARWGWTALAAFFGLTQLFTMQRIGWLALAGGYGTVIAFAAWVQGDASARLRRTASRIGLYAGALALLVLAMALASADLRQRLGELLALEQRTVIWRSALEMIVQVPLSGAGLGNYFHIYIQVLPTDDPMIRADNVTAHNLYLHLMAERGAIGLAIFMILFVTVLRRLGRAAAARPEATNPTWDGPRMMSLATLAGLTAMAIDGLAQYVFYVRIIEVLFWMMVGGSTWLVAAPAMPAPAAAAPFRVRHARLFWGGLFALFILAECWENRYSLGQRMNVIYMDEANLYVAGKQVSLAWPEGARQVQVAIGCADPDAAKAPVRYTLSVGGRVLKEIEINRMMHAETVDLTWPEGMVPGEKLVITASRTWSPWGYGLRYWPFMTAGVLYLPPVRLGEGSTECYRN